MIWARLVKSVSKLGIAADLQTWMPRGNSLCWFCDACQQINESRLSAAVETDNADPVTHVNDKVNILQDSDNRTVRLSVTTVLESCLFQ